MAPFFRVRADRLRRARQSSRRLAGRRYVAKRLGDRGLYLRMPGLAQVPHGSRQVRRAYKHGIHSFDGGDGLEVVQRSYGLRLHDQAGLGIGPRWRKFSICAQREARVIEVASPRIPRGG